MTANPNTETFNLTCELISQPSISPLDCNCQELIAKRLQASGFDITHMPFADVSNLWATHGNKSPLFVFAGHTDVVPVGDEKAWHSDPFTPVVRDGYLYGRGATDMKGGLAAMIVAAQEFIAEQPNYQGSIGFLITSDEEADAINGTVKVMDALDKQQIKMDAVLIGEPSSTSKAGDVMRNGRRGSMTFSLHIQGIQGHVAYPHLADNPIHKIGKFMDELVKYEWDNGDEYFPPSSLQIVELKSGGLATNIIPADVKLVFNIRFSTQQTPNKITTTINNLLQQHNLADCTTATSNISGNPFITNKNSPLVKSAQQAISTTAGITTELSTGGGTSDGRFIAPFGIDVVELGSINATAHKVNESVKCDDLEILKNTYKQTLSNFFK